MPMSGVNWFDAVVLAGLLYGVLSGVRAGFSGEILRMLGLILMLVVAANTYESLGAWLGLNWNIDADLANLGAFISIAVAIYLSVTLIRVAVHKRMQQRSFGSVVENFGGGIAGVIRMFTIMAAVGILLALSGSRFWYEQVAQQSRFGAAVVSQFPAIERVAKQHLPEKFRLARETKRRPEINIESDSAAQAGK
jgi:uncharacterized membrane protein required for colicin V production